MTDTTNTYILKTGTITGNAGDMTGVRAAFREYALDDVFNKVWVAVIPRKWFTDEMKSKYPDTPMFQAHMKDGDNLFTLDGGEVTFTEVLEQGWSDPDDHGGRWQELRHSISIDDEEISVVHKLHYDKGLFQE